MENSDSSQRDLVEKNGGDKIAMIPYLLVPTVKLLDVFVSVGDLHPLQVPMPVEDKLWRGSSRGWIVAIENGPNIYLINPLSGIQTQLPPITTFPGVIEYRPHCAGQEYLIQTDTDTGNSEPCIFSSEHIRNCFIQKIVLSSSKDYVAMAIYGHELSKLACCRQGEERWIDVEGVGQENEVWDIIFCKDKFYAVAITEGSGGFVYVITDLDSSSPRAVRIAPPPPQPERFDGTAAGRLYLVEFSDDLLMVARYIEYEVKSKILETVNFMILKLKLNSDSTWAEWSNEGELKSLGDRALFLGSNESMSLSASSLPGCKHDSIYFTDDAFEEYKEKVRSGGADLGVFNYKNKTCSRIRGYKQYSYFLSPPPVWFIAQ